jgi:hypothetical protein
MNWSTNSPTGLAPKGCLRLLRNLIVLVVMATGFAISFTMLQRSIGSSSPWLGLLAVVYFLGLSKVAEPLFLLRMPAVLREVRACENDGAMYRRLRVRSFGRLLRETPLRYLNPAVYLSKKQPDPPKVYRQIEAAEAAHFWAALLFTPYIGYVLLRGNHLPEVIVLLLFQVFFNIYPILHLRIVRGRLARIAQRPHARQIASTTTSDLELLPATGGRSRPQGAKESSP